ncbi:hypothetical protein RIF29_14031 [Crotalaria pallida]|uniref:Uncharacterized protein n=1 Tax=Crotalaria pallida TaxID=3830 RepID=A0AAN9FEQ5_CROPI
MDRFAVQSFFAVNGDWDVQIIRLVFGDVLRKIHVVLPTSLDGNNDKMSWRHINNHHLIRTKFRNPKVLLLSIPNPT